MPPCCFLSVDSSRKRPHLPPVSLPRYRRSMGFLRRLGRHRSSPTRWRFQLSVGRMKPLRVGGDASDFSSRFCAHSPEICDWG